MSNDKEAEQARFPKPLSPLAPIGDSDSADHAEFDNEGFEVTFNDSEVTIWPSFDDGIIVMGRESVARLRDLLGGWLKTHA